MYFITKITHTCIFPEIRFGMLSTKFIPESKIDTSHLYLLTIHLCLLTFAFFFKPTSHKENKPSQNPYSASLMWFHPKASIFMSGPLLLAIKTPAFSSVVWPMILIPSSPFTFSKSFIFIVNKSS